MLTYTAEGTTSVVLMQRGRPKFSGGLDAPTAEELRAAFFGFDAYCGTYTLDTDAKKVTHHVLASRMPDWEGTDQIRFFELDEDTLTIRSAPNNSSGHRMDRNRRVEQIQKGVLTAKNSGLSKGEQGTMRVKMSKVESAMRAALAFYEAFNRHDIAGMVSLMGRDSVLESIGPAPRGAIFRGEADVARYWQGFFEEKPQAAIELEEVFGLGKRCVGRWTCSWTDATGERAVIRGTDIFKVTDDAIQEILSYVKG